MNLFETIAQGFASYRIEYLVGSCITVFLLTLGWWVATRLKTPWNGIAYLVLAVLTMRLLMLENPKTWRQYNTLLSSADVGFRQNGVLRIDNQRFYPKPSGIRYLAIGSSQTNAVYWLYAAKHSNFSKFYIAGLGPLDYMLYRKHIGRYKPETILLYLSEFDIARKPDLDGSKLAPAQGFYWFKLMPMILKHYIWDDRGMGLSEMLVGDFFPEYKYSFIFRGFVNKWFKKNEALGEENILDLTPQEQLEKHLGLIEEKLRDDAIDFNMAFISEFIECFDKQDVDVVIVEGQYHPSAYNERNNGYNRQVQHELVELDRKYASARFIPRSELTLFTADQYKDGYHVTDEAGYNFTERLVEYLERNPDRK